MVLQADSRLTVLGARPNTFAIVRSEWPWVRPRLKVSGLQHSSACSILLAWQHRSPLGPVVLHLELELKGGIKEEPR